MLGLNLNNRNKFWKRSWKRVGRAGSRLGKKCESRGRGRYGEFLVFKRWRTQPSHQSLLRGLRRLMTRSGGGDKREKFHSFFLRRFRRPAPSANFPSKNKPKLLRNKQALFRSNSALAFGRSHIGVNHLWRALPACSLYIKEFRPEVAVKNPRIGFAFQFASQMRN